MTLEIVAINVLKSIKDKKSKKTSHPSDHKMSEKLFHVSLVVLAVILLLFVWALVRAYKCSNKNNRVTHMFFATVTPMTYLLLSYVVPGFCNKHNHH